MESIKHDDWRHDDDKKLKAACVRHAQWRWVARDVGRSKEECQTRAAELGYKRKPAFQRNASQEDEKDDDDEEKWISLTFTS
eukprot:911954-Prymnesium_polylepis.1